MSKMRLLISTIVLIVLVGVLVVFFMSTTIIDSLEVVGNDRMTRIDVMDKVGIYDTSSVLDVLLNPIVIIEDDGYISRVEVEKIDLKHVIIHVYEKEIIGYVEYMGKYICIDNSGFIVDYTDNPDPKKPTIYGVDLASFSIDEPIEVSDRIVKSIDTIYRNSISFEVPIDGIDFAFGQGSHILLQAGNIQIQIGDTTRIEEKFESIKEVLKVLPLSEEGVLIVENVDDDIIFKKASH